MRYLLRRELKYKKMEVVKDTLTLLVVPVLCMITCMIAGDDYMRTLGEYIYGSGTGIQATRYCKNRWL